MSGEFIVLATKNEGKVKEIKELLKGEGVNILSLAELQEIPEPVEDAMTFEDNAYIKALYYARNYGFPALAEDSGLSVDALGGRPGVFSARYAGEGANDKDKYTKLLAEMDGKDDRRAEFVCALVLAVPSGPALTWVGKCQGEITREPFGDGGFGYDPVFFYPPLEKTFGQITTGEKNQVSHRGAALTEFKEEFPKVMIWLGHRLKEINPGHGH